MRLASALAAASLFLLPAALAQDGYVTSVSTFTLTKTVERVVETTWATRSSVLPSPSDNDLPHEPTFAPSAVMPSASLGYPQGNGTKPTLSGSSGLSSSTSALPQATGNAASRMVGTGSFALAAVAGFVGAMVL